MKGKICTIRDPLEKKCSPGSFFPSTGKYGRTAGLDSTPSNAIEALESYRFMQQNHKEHDVGDAITVNYNEKAGQWHVRPIKSLIEAAPEANKDADTIDAALNAALGAVENKGGVVDDNDQALIQEWKNIKKNKTGGLKLKTFLYLLLPMVGYLKKSLPVGETGKLEELREKWKEFMSTDEAIALLSNNPPLSGLTGTSLINATAWDSNNNTVLNGSPPARIKLNADNKGFGPSGDLTDEKGPLEIFYGTSSLMNSGDVPTADATTTAWDVRNNPYVSKQPNNPLGPNATKLNFDSAVPAVSPQDFKKIGAPRANNMLYGDNLVGTMEEPSVNTHHKFDFFNKDKWAKELAGHNAYTKETNEANRVNLTPPKTPSGGNVIKKSKKQRNYGKKNSRKKRCGNKNSKRKKNCRNRKSRKVVTRTKR